MHFRTVTQCGQHAALIVVAACLTGCQSDETPATPSATVATAPATTAPSTTTTLVPTVAPTPEQEVEAAYLKSWEVYADALLRLDGSRFPEVYVDDALTMRNEELAELVLAQHAGPGRWWSTTTRSSLRMAAQRAIVTDSVPEPQRASRRPTHAAHRGRPQQAALAVSTS